MVNPRYSGSDTIISVVLVPRFCRCYLRTSEVRVLGKAVVI